MANTPKEVAIPAHILAMTPEELEAIPGVGPGETSPEWIRWHMRHNSAFTAYIGQDSGNKPRRASRRRTQAPKGTEASVQASSVAPAPAKGSKGAKGAKGTKRGKGAQAGAVTAASEEVARDQTDDPVS
ncbi:MAG TPA: hypothetical protein VF914_14285 [Chloroflexia bacterium]|jgi:hypothetical protein